MITNEEKAIRQRLKDDFVHFASKCLKINTKNESLKPLYLNKAQMYLHSIAEKQLKEIGKVRIIILKGRQMGLSTVISARNYWRVIHNFGVNAFVLAHNERASKNIFKMTKRFHENCNPLLKPHTAASNTNELVFDKLDSSFKIGTAGNQETGRSDTIQFLHCSEVAFWPNADFLASGLMNAVPDMDNTEIILESTACGIGSYFHTQWLLAVEGKSDFIPVFIPWFWQDEYQRPVDDDFALTEDEHELMNAYKLTKEQLSWRRNKIAQSTSHNIDGNRKFAQEYPCNSVEAFQLADQNSYIDAHLIMRCRKERELEKIGGLIIGVDPARYGNDRTSIIFRQGRVAFNHKSYVKKNTMEVAGIVNNLITSFKPDKVCVDVGGLGAGVVDRLRELGHNELIEAVNAGSSPMNQELYVNKRAEMWGELKKWMQDGPVKIPDCDELHADLAAIRYSYDSKSRLMMEKKESMKKRGLRSPDIADALCLTFALPSTALYNQDTHYDDIAQQFMARDMQLKSVRKNRYAKY